MNLPASGVLVPRETLSALEAYLDLLLAWNRRMNLVSRRGSDNIWHRHILDSAQLAYLAPPAALTWLDLGSGAGFPGVVCSVLARAQDRPTQFTLVEADARKVAFMREATRRLGVQVTVLHGRVEQLSLPPQGVVSARALASLDQLLSYAAPFCGPETVLLFPKGKQADSELTLARHDWHSRVVRIPSCTDPDATILRLSEVRRRR